MRTLALDLSLYLSSTADGICVFVVMHCGTFAPNLVRSLAA